jgi:hypothetical protein
MDYRARFYHPVLARFIQPDSIIPYLTNPQSLNRYSYVVNRPTIYTDPSGHEVCWEGSQFGNCLNKIGYLKKDLEDTYSIKIEGRWETKEILLLGAALEQAAELVGGVEKLKIELRTSMKNQKAKRDVFTFWMVSDDERRRLCGYAGTTSGSPCAPASGAVFSPSNFTPSWRPRVPTWAEGKPDVIAEIMILHEISHHLINANPIILVAYASPRSSLITNPTAFEKWPVESLADAIAYYAILDGQSYPGYEDQMDFVRGWQW